MMDRQLCHQGALLACVIALALPSASTAQGVAGRVSGRVMHRGGAAGIGGAEVILQGDGRHTLTDSTGRYAFAGIGGGARRFLVRALGFRPVELAVTLAEGNQVLEDVELDSAETSPQALAPVSITVKARAENYRLVDFERRRRTGRGHYLDDEEITRSGAARLQDLVRGMRGVTEHCAGNGCRIQMVRARTGCEPDYVVDGRVDNMFGSSTPIRDIVGLEVYTGPSDVPGEFAGKSAGCGVIVIWTRAGPPRAKR